MKVRNIKRCGRCGGDHDELEMKAFDRPVAPPELDFAWDCWAMCPTSGDPILIYRYNTDPNADVNFPVAP